MNQGTFLFYAFFVSLFLGALMCAIKISVTDWRRRIIPDAFLFPLLLAGMLAATFWHNWPISPQQAAIGAAFGYTMAAALGWAIDYKLQKSNPDAPAAIGMGDIKLIATGGIWLGTTGLAAALVFSSLMSAIWSHRTKQKYVPFAPFFVAGGILSFIGLLFLL